jgi:hypothetical protein
MSVRASVIAVTAAICLAASSGPAAAQGAPAPANFQVRTVADLAALCGASPGQATAEAARYLCHGFLIGVGQYHSATRRTGTAYPPLFCPPSPPPSLNQAGAGFTAWAGANPQFSGERAVDGLIRWAQLTYPCSSGQGRLSR